MKKCLLVVGMISTMLFPVFAEYTLKADDQKAIDAVIQKIKAKSIRTQEKAIKTLKDAQTKTNLTEQKRAIITAVEKGLRKKSTVDGKTVVLATQLEREYIKKTFVTKNVEQKDGSVTLDVSGKLTSTAMPVVVTFDTHMAVDVDMHDLKNPKVRVAIDASGAADEENISGAAEMRVVDALVFFKVATLTSTSPDIRDELVALQPFLNTWWKFPLSETDLADIAETEKSTIQTSQTQSLEYILLRKNILPTLQYIGQDKGVSTYGGTIDNKVLLSVIREIALSEGEEMAESDLIEAENMLKNVSIFTQFSLTEKNIFTAFSIATVIRPTLVEPGNTIKGNINIDMTVSPLKSPIVAPANAKEFNEASLMGL